MELGPLFRVQSKYQPGLWLWVLVQVDPVIGRIHFLAAVEFVVVFSKPIDDLSLQEGRSLSFKTFYLVDSEPPRIIMSFMMNSKSTHLVF